MTTSDPATYEALLDRAAELEGRLADHGAPRVAHVRATAPQTPGQRAADAFATTIGSWRFIIIQTVFLAGWLALNVVGFIGRWDSYPFILLNLMLSFQAAYAGPIIMMSQNRASEMDRLQAYADYEVNRKAELEVEQLDVTVSVGWPALSRL